jgi:hypothetical protein
MEAHLLRKREINLVLEERKEIGVSQNGSGKILPEIRDGA